MTTERLVETEREVLDIDFETPEDDDAEEVVEEDAPTGVSPDTAEPSGVPRDPTWLESVTPLVEPAKLNEQRRIQDQQRRFQEQSDLQQQELNAYHVAEFQRKKADELTQRQSDWEEQGFSPDEVQKHTRSWQDLEQGKIEVANQKQAVAQYGQIMEAERQMTEGFISMYMQQYGVGRDILVGAKTPEAMENRALKHEKAQMKQSKTPVTSPDNSVPSSSSSANKARRMDQLMAKDELTDREHAELGKLTGNR
jgi:hypothetical protein